MTSHNRVIIDSGALAHNYRYLRSRVGPRAGLMAMIKSDAYGHSMYQCARVFGDLGCTLFGVAEMEEGVSLREAGCAGSIFIFLGFEAAEVDCLFSHRLTPVVFSFEQLQLLAEAQKRAGTRLDVYLKFDCGMSRLGFTPREVAAVFERCRELAIEPRGMISHFPCSDDRQSNNSIEVSELFHQIRRSQPAAAGLAASLCNSGGLLYQPGAHGDLVRAGITLYGYYPDGRRGREEDGAGGLKPALKCVTRVIQVRTVAAGGGISYGHTFVSERETRLAVLPIGYSDGYFLRLSNRAEVLIRGCRAPVRGRICMNMCMVDITAIDGVAPGDEAVLLGSQGGETIDADDIGSWGSTISYEVLCSLGNNNRREFV